MKYMELKEGTHLPLLGLGTSGIGGSKPDPELDKKGIESIRMAIIGFKHLDTAEVYGDNHTEELIGRAIESYEREDLFITTKVSGEHLRY
jgi:aryl-alcohol dehydrogenase-like predicted oxidoreductase